jgi:TMEM175 potassium channel family protein
MDRGRLEAFSDGVFAVAITLLALNLAVKGPGNGTLAHQLGHQWPGYVAYVISFFTIGIIWVNHHMLVSNVVVVTRLLLFLNLVLLLFVVLIPVVTATVADYLQAGGFDAKLAVALYGVVLTGMSVGFSSIAEWSLRPGRTLVPVPPDKRWAARIRFMSGGLVYLLITGCAFLSATVALGLSGLVAVYYVFERTPAAGRVAGTTETTETAETGGPAGPAGPQDG